MAQNRANKQMRDDSDMESKMDAQRERYYKSIANDPHQTYTDRDANIKYKQLRDTGMGHASAEAHLKKNDYPITTVKKSKAKKPRALT